MSAMVMEVCGLVRLPIVQCSVAYGYNVWTLFKGENSRMVQRHFVSRVRMTVFGFGLKMGYDKIDE